ncbi:Uncharacterised protein [Mycobacteroides abscessus subsp. abscessus]|uniref:hypothetical protein n=1 Tax=Mycobacteroides abscessus TaxID=36809 RepID=UPI0009276170|nr:hypothetical protein [Mycobacteroides abscessus]SIM06038.1 Uncharacterised protein [Mycobacteroides abscessus subsp. abscessus]SLC77291.1 Uncharacterised protein [Mycobacteroides abscessus subsp. abscessus]
MLGSDPIAALLGAGLDARSPQVIWKGYLRKLATAGCAVTMLGPDVVVPDGVDAETLTALAELTRRFPSQVAMPEESTGKLSGQGQVDSTGEQINARVTTYYRHITKIVGAERAPVLLESGVITPSAGIYIPFSHMVAVTIPDADALTQWRTWAAQTSGDPYELHTAPTLLVPGLPGGGVYLFTTPHTSADNQHPTAIGYAPVTGLTFELGSVTVSAGQLTVPIPPTRMAGASVMRLGPCRKLPAWLESALRTYGTVAASPAA